MPIRILFMEDSEGDAELIGAHLRRGGLHVVAARVDSAAAYSMALTDFAPDAVLSDHGTPGFGALAALRLLREGGPAVPFIVVAGAVDEDSAVSLLRSGADDVVLKSRLDRLKPALDEALAVRERLRMLSPRQLDVLRLIVQGHTTPEVAERLGVSVKTVETHRSEMMRRLDIHNVAGLVRYAVKVRLISAG